MFNFLLSSCICFWDPFFYICVCSSVPLEESCCVYCCDAAANMKLAVLRLDFFHTAQSSQMPVERILLLYLTEVIYLIRAIYILGKGGLWQQMHSFMRAPLRPALSVDFPGTAIHTVVFIYFSLWTAVIIHPLFFSWRIPWVITHGGMTLWQPHPWLKALNCLKPYDATWEIQQW